MYPEILRIGDLAINTYGFMFNLGIIVIAILLFRESRHEAIDPFLLLEALLVAVVAGILGSRALYIALNWELYSSQPTLYIITDFGGLTFYGGFFSGWIAGFFWSRWRKVNYLFIFDIFAPYVMLGHAFGRIGCLLNGCCYGRISDLPWALPASAVDPFMHHPVQLYDAFGALLIFFILKLLRNKRPFDGFCLLSLFVLYGILRFITEFFRFEQPVWLNLTLAQLFSLGLTILSLLVIAFIMHIRGNKNEMDI